MSLVTAGHNIVQDLVKPIIREALYQRPIKTQYGRKASYHRQPVGLFVLCVLPIWRPGVTNILDTRDKDRGSKCQSLAPGYFGPGCSIQFSALRQLTDRTELGHGVGSIDILIFETHGTLNE